MEMDHINSLCEFIWIQFLISQSEIKNRPSGKTLTIANAAQTLLLVMDQEWLGVGRIRCGFIIDGVIYYGQLEDDPIASSNRDYANVKLAVSSRMTNDSLTNDSELLDPICFVKGTKILCFLNETEVYIPIENLTTDHYVKTYANGYKKYPIINSTRRPVTKKQKINKIYKLAKEDYAELFEDLYVNGGHSILVDTLTEEENRINLKLFGGYKKIEDKIRLLTYINQKAIPVNNDFRYDMYHITTGEEEGIYANGILTESYNLENNIKM